MGVNFKPNQGMVLIEPKAAETKTASGLYIPDTAKEKTQQGKVVAVGDAKEDQASFKEGDMVVYGKFSGTPYNQDGIEYLILKVEDILGTIL